MLGERVCLALEYGESDGILRRCSSRMLYPHYPISSLGETIEKMHKIKHSPWLENMLQLIKRGGKYQDKQL